MPVITHISQLDPTKTYTYADYLTWRLDEFVELIKGKVRLMSPAPLSSHQTISFNLGGAIHAGLRGQKCRGFAAPFDVRLTTAGPNGDDQITTVVQPDLCVVCDPDKIDRRGCLGAPDWVIEILSPKTAAYDTREKFSLYEEAGVAEYWLVFPGEQTVVTYVLEAGSYQLHGEYFEPGVIPVQTLPGFAVEWAEVFEGV
ncbi:restriction endonuclease [Hymenobacter amundsenii]|uniref:Restriction endonuclease n=1 Tax=Hymenobacter amundsenii TaxID=2006685 RepID=A0A246FGU8_9BACT|nr:Uma2 family endonuclease [Hymenobacter amundsenii]OWP61741.1 restriction endonuclease [Hymenobacter amundsenii]